MIIEMDTRNQKDEYVTDYLDSHTSFDYDNFIDKIKNNIEELRGGISSETEIGIEKENPDPELEPEPESTIKIPDKRVFKLAQKTITVEKNKK